MENYLKMITNYPKKIEKININSYNENFNLNLLDLNNIYIYDKSDPNLIFYKKEKELSLLNNNFEKEKLFDILDNGYLDFNIFKFDDNICLSVSDYKKTKFYIYDDNFELINKIELKEIKQYFYPIFLNNSLLIVQKNDKYLILTKYFFYDNILEENCKIKFDLIDDNNIFSITNSVVYLYNGNILFLIDTNDCKILEKKFMDCKIIESFYNITFIVNENIEIFDKGIKRQTIQRNNIDTIDFKNSYLILSNFTENKIYIYALDENGFFIYFGKIHNIGNIINSKFFDFTILLNTDQKNVYIDLPKRIFNDSNFTGYGFYTNNLSNNLLYLNNGNITLLKDKYSLIIGSMKNFNKYEEIIINYEQVENSFNITELNKDYVLISNNNSNILNTEITNYLFIEEKNFILYLESTDKTLLQIDINNTKKNIIWEKDGIVKIEIFNNSMMLELKTKMEIKVLGYLKNKDYEKWSSDIKILSNSNDILFPNRIIQQYQCFFPYVHNDNISSVVGKKITDFDIKFEHNDIENNLPKFYKSSLEITNKTFLNKRYSISIKDNNLITIIDLFNSKKIGAYTLLNANNILNIKYVNPYIIVLSNDDYENTFINLINTKENKRVPYTISNLKNEKILENFELENDKLIFISDVNNNTNKLYILDINDLNIVQKINFDEKITDIKLFENYLLVRTINNEVILYNLKNLKAIISYQEDTLVDFDIFDNYIAFLLFDENYQIHYYKIVDNTIDLLFKKKLNDLIFSENCLIFININRIIIGNNKTINIYENNYRNELILQYQINEKLIYNFKNLFISRDENNYYLNKFNPTIKLNDKNITSEIDFNKMFIKKINDIPIINIFLTGNSKSKLKIAEKNLDLSMLPLNNSIFKLQLNIKSINEIIIKTENLKFNGIIIDKILEKIPCFLQGTLVSTPNGEIEIEKLNKGDIIYDDKNNSVKILSTQQWEIIEKNINNFPYLIPANSLKNNYPKYDTYVSPFHKIQLPNGNLERVCNINLPFIKQYKKIEKVIYYNFILENNSFFKANNLIVESLDKRNDLIKK